MATALVDPCNEGVIRSGKASEGCAKKQGRWILVATILASSMAFIDGTVVNVALPFLQKSLNATVIGVQWVVEGYSLFLSALLLVGGSLGDRYGRRLIFNVGVVVFAVASVVCGLSQNIEQLIISRAIQGIGGALLVPGSLAIISNSFAPDQRGKAIGTWSGFSAITTAIGPLLGGWLVQNVSWRAVFFLNLPLALAVVSISLWQVPESREKTANGSLDWLGAGLATIGLAGLVFGLIESARMGFTDPLVIFALVAGVVSFGLFVLNESRVRNPMVPLKLFRSPDFTGANLLTLLLYGALGAMFFFFALNLIQVQGYSATAAGAAMLPFIALMFLLSRWSGGLRDRFGSRLPLLFGPTIAAIGFALFALPEVSSNYWTSFFPAVVVLGLGMAISVAPLTTTVMDAVSKEEAGLASGINNALSRAAGLLAVAIFGVIMVHTFSRSLSVRLNELKVADEVRRSVLEQRVRLAGLELPGNIDEVTRRQLEESVHGSFVSGFRLIMLISAALALGATLSAWLLIGRSDRFHPNQNGKEANQQKAQ